MENRCSADGDDEVQIYFVLSNKQSFALAALRIDACRCLIAPRAIAPRQKLGPQLNCQEGHPT